MTALETHKGDTASGMRDEFAAPVRSSSGRAGHSIQQTRICHVSMTLLTGGLERLLVEFGRHHDAERFSLSFLALDGLGVPADELRALGHEVRCISDEVSGKLARLRRLVQIFRDGQFDVVHTHNTLAHFYGAIAAKLAGVPVVVNSQHGRGCGNSWKARLQFRIANRATDRVVGVSEDAATLCRNDDRGSGDKTIAIWNGIDVDRFEYRGPSTEPIGITVSRLSPEKDLSTMLRAVWILIKDQPDFRLRIVGDGSDRPHLERLVEELSLSDHVEFLGERSDIPSLLAKAGFFVSSSRTEGISLTLLEAMATGLPVVATRVGGNPEIVIEGKTGHLVPSGSPEELALAMRELLKEPEAWPVYGELGRQRIEQDFNIRMMVRQYEDLYRDVLDSKAGNTD